MRAPTVAEFVTLMIRQSREDRQFFPMSRQGLKNERQFIVSAHGCRRPIRHVRAIRHIDPRHAFGKSSGGTYAGERADRQERIKDRQRNRRSQPAQERSSGHLPLVVTHERVGF